MLEGKKTYWAIQSTNGQTEEKGGVHLQTEDKQKLHVISFDSQV